MIPQARTIEHGTLFQRVLFTAGLLISSLPATAQQANKATEEAAKPAAEIAKPAENEVITLSPFVVTADDNQGYQATHTLAGSRLRTELKNVAASIQVFTPELLSDLGATDAGTILAYGLNTEVGGLQGNFTGFTSSTANRSDQDEARTNPQGTQRVRGLGAATLTRNFFLTDIPFDSYNASSITINRGPNSILFGVGSPSGIIDAGLSRATLGRDRTEVVFRGGKNESYRTSFNINKVLVKNRLALRVAALHAKENANQQPSFQQDRRLFGDLQAVLLENKKSDFLGTTTLRANVEFGKIASNPPMVIPPKVTYNDWWSGVTTDFTKYTGVAVPATVRTAANGGTYVPQSTIAGALAASPFAQRPFFFAPALVYAQPGSSDPFGGFKVNFPTADGYVGDMLTSAGANGTNFRTFWSKAGETSNYGTGFAPPVLQNRNTFDYRNQLFTGDTNRVYQNFRVYNASLEQLFFKDNRAGIELSYGKEELKRNALLVGSDRVFSVYADSDVSIDLMQTLPNGEPNPNVGRVVVRINNLGQSSERQIAHEAARATAFYKLDFAKFNQRLSWLGTHTFSGLVEQNENSSENRGYSMVWDTSPSSLRNTVYAGALGANNNARVVGLVYLNTVDARTLNGPDKVTFGPLNLTLPVAGETYKVVYQPLNLTPAARRGTYQTIDLLTRQILDGGNIDKKIINSRAFTLQSSFWQKRVDTIMGWRHDTAKTYGALTPAQRAVLTGSTADRDVDGIYLPQNFLYQSAPTSTESGNTFTSSAVVHLPAKWTARLPFSPAVNLLFGQSKNFDPAGVRRNAYGAALPSPLGETKEMGFSVDFGPKLYLRMNWYESSAALASVGGLNAAGIADRVGTFFVQRGVVDTQNLGWTWAQTKTEILRDIDGNPIADTIPTINSYADYQKLLLGLLPATIGDRLNFRVINNGGNYQLVSDPLDNRVATNNQTSKGLEIELVSSPVKGLRLMMNVAKQTTVTNDTGKDLFELATTILANMKTAGIYDLRDSPNNQAPGRFGDRYTTDILTPIIAAQIKDGTQSQEQRKWRANLIANYTFSNSKLKGFGLGSAARWQDKGAIGYYQIIRSDGTVAPDLSRPYFSPSQLNGDLWVSYNRKLTKKINWKMQVNFRNAFGDHEDIAIRANPDGSVPIVRIPQERTWFVTNTFSF